MPLLILSIALGAARAGSPPCSAGSFSFNGIEPCTPCDPGTFAANQGAFVCEPCAIGTFTADAGASSCQDCALGSYASQPGTIACTLCEPGRFADIYGAFECQACPPGYFSDQAGQSSCLICSAGTAAAEAGSSACQPCAAGRFSASSGAAACGECPRNAHAPDSGLTQCLACGCDDAFECTRDACDAVSGACAAPAVPACQPIEVAFSGTVSLVDPLLYSTAPPGSPVEGRFSYDPEAPDATPLDPSLGDYPNAVTGFEVSIGVGPAISATSPGGSVHVENGVVVGWDVVDFEASAADGLDGPPLDALPDGVRESYRLRLADAGGSALASDALPAARPDFARFPIRSASLEIHSPSAAGNVYVDSYDVQDAPEPHATLASATAFAGLLALEKGDGPPSDLVEDSRDMPRQGVSPKSPASPRRGPSPFSVPFLPGRDRSRWPRRLAIASRATVVACTSATQALVRNASSAAARSAARDGAERIASTGRRSSDGMGVAVY